MKYGLLVLALSVAVLAGPVAAGENTDQEWVTYNNGSLGLFAIYGPQRAMLINPPDFGLTYPFQIDSLLTRFYAGMGGFLDSAFWYVIYGDDGQTVLFESEMLLAVRPPQIFRYKIPTPVVINSGKFYIALRVRTYQGSVAYPIITTDNASGMPHCWYGQPGGWTNGPEDCGEYHIAAFVNDVSGETHDVGCSMVLAPKDTVDFGATRTPACSLANYGTVAESYLVRMRIGTSYNQTAQVAGHGPGTKYYVEFPQWSATELGRLAIACSTELAVDENTANDKATDSVFVRGLDAEAVSIEAPVDTVELGSATEPKATVRNSGNTAQSFDVLLRITDGYSDTKTTAVLAPGAAEQLTFAEWHADTPGSFDVACTTRLDGDLDNGNDKQTARVFVRGLDAEVVSIEAPVDTVELGSATEPRATVRNAGNTAQSFDVLLRITDGYADTKTTSVLAPGGTEQLTFAEWHADTPGSFDVACTTRLDGDADNGNDKQTGTVFVRGLDVGAVSITTPSGSYAQGSVVTPEATWHNYGNTAVGFEAWMLLSDPNRDARVYEEKVDVPELEPGEDITVNTFPGFGLNVPGTWAVRCSTHLAGDANPDNDTIDDEFLVVANPAVDAGVTGIVAPSGRYDTSEAVVPRARVRNNGEVNMSFPAWFMIADTALDQEVYRQTAAVSGLGPGAEVAVDFPEWPGGLVQGPYAARCSLAVEDDEPQNDTLSSSFLVVAGRFWPYGWEEVRPMPVSAGGRPVSHGGWLAAGPDSTAYAARGYKTPDFYLYDAAADAWSELEPIPADEEGRTRLPGKGCCGVFDGMGSVYMVKGNNTLGFWRYDAGDGSWHALPGVPPGPESKKVKGGTDIVYVQKDDTGYVYLLKGYRNEFYRYNVNRGQWDALDEVPYGAGRRKYGNGSFLVYDGDNAIYAHQAKYTDGLNHYMFRYDIAAGQWSGQQLSGIPLVGRHGGVPRQKRSRDGAGGVWSAGISALKGGNTQQFFRYFPEGDTWQELDTMPSNGSTGTRKYLKYGGDIVALMPGVFFALKGNKTLECWRYVEPALQASRLTPYAGDGIAGDGRLQTADCRMQIAPNPIASGFATLRIQGVKESRGQVANVGAYDVLGRCVLVRQLVTGSRLLGIPLDVRSLSSGVYLLRLDAGGHTATQKLVVQR